MKFIRVVVFITSYIYLGQGQVLVEAETQKETFSIESIIIGGIINDFVNLTKIDVGYHSDFTRVVFRFGLGRKGDKPSPVVPYYEVQYKKYPYRLEITFVGVRWIKSTPPKKKLKGLIRSIHYLFPDDNETLLVHIYLSYPIRMRVASLICPSRLIIDLKKNKDKDFSLKEVYFIRINSEINGGNPWRTQRDLMEEKIDSNLLILNDRKTIVVESKSFLEKKNALAFLKKLTRLGFDAKLVKRGPNMLPKGVKF